MAGNLQTLGGLVDASEEKPAGLAAVFQQTLQAAIGTEPGIGLAEPVREPWEVFWARFWWDADCHGMCSEVWDGFDAAVAAAIERTAGTGKVFDAGTQEAIEEAQRRIDRYFMTHGIDRGEFDEWVAGADQANMFDREKGRPDDLPLPPRISKRNAHKPPLVWGSLAGMVLRRCHRGTYSAASGGPSWRFNEPDAHLYWHYASWALLAEAIMDYRAGWLAPHLKESVRRHDA